MPPRLSCPGRSAAQQTSLRSLRKLDCVAQRITLLEADPAIWRRIEVPADATLRGLHDVIQVVMGWQDYHLHLFQIGGTMYGQATPEDPELADERKLKLASACSGESLPRT